MPPLTTSQKKDRIKKVRKAFAVIGKELTDAEMKQLLNDPKRDEVHKLGEEYADFRTKGERFIRENYPDIKYKKFNRLAGFYMDMSGTPEAHAKNRELLTSLTTEEGCVRFAKMAASDILNVDLKVLLPSGTLEEKLRTYAKHAREIELCWAALDIKNDAEQYLDKPVYDLINERLPILQTGGDYVLYARLAASDLYTVMPELTPEEVAAVAAADDEDIPNGFYQNGIDEQFIHDFSAFSSNTGILQMHAGDDMASVMEKAIEMEKNGELTPYTVAKNENGERVRLGDGISATLRGEKVTFEENAADKPMISSYIKEAGKPIKMPKKGTALYDTFSEEALSAQGKGLQAECARLEKILDGARLWYTGGSQTFRDIKTLLKETASGDLLNKEEALDRINNILTLCEKYTADKKGLALKEREQKRLDAVNAVKESLYAKKNFLRGVKIKGDAMHFEAENGLGNKTMAFHTSVENQAHYHIAESDRKAVLYKKELDACKNEEGAVGRLAESVGKTVEKLAMYSVGEKRTGERPKFITDGSLPKAIAEMAVFEFVRGERAMAKKHNAAQLKGNTERMLDKLSQKDITWERMLNRVAQTDTVRKLTEDIAESPEGAAEYFVKNGPGKLLADLMTELKVTAPEPNKNAVAESAPEIGKTDNIPVVE